MSSRRTYAIGDVHGHLDRLREVHEWIEADTKAYKGEVTVVHLGDLTDRGPDSAGVIDWLIAGIAAQKPWVVLKGNHDRMMARFLEETPRRDEALRPDLDWLDPRLGGRTTLASYGVDVSDNLGISEIHAAARVAVPPAHVEFLENLDVMHQAGGFAFVHAGVRPGIGLNDQTEEDLIWIRAPFHQATDDHGAVIVHGHTPVKEILHHGNRINIDTGVAYGGPLSVIATEGVSAYQLGPDGRRDIPAADLSGLGKPSKRS